MKCLACKKGDMQIDDDAQSYSCLVCWVSIPCEYIEKIAELQAVIAKTLKTKDGVPVVEGMTLYSSHFICSSFRKPEVVTGLAAFADSDISEWMDGCLDAEELYSTREAADAAHNCTAQPCGDYPKCKGSEAENG